jgi:hypothetical protein
VTVPLDLKTLSAREFALFLNTKPSEKQIAAWLYQTLSARAARRALREGGSLLGLAGVLVLTATAIGVKTSLPALAWLACLVGAVFAVSWARRRLEKAFPYWATYRAQDKWDKPLSASPEKYPELLAAVRGRPELLLAQGRELVMADLDYAQGFLALEEAERTRIDPLEARAAVHALMATRQAGTRKNA